MAMEKRGLVDDTTPPSEPPAAGEKRGDAAGDNAFGRLIDTAARNSARPDKEVPGAQQRDRR